MRSNYQTITYKQIIGAHTLPPQKLIVLIIT